MQLLVLFALLVFTIPNSTFADNGDCSDFFASVNSNNLKILSVRIVIGKKSFGIIVDHETKQIYIPEEFVMVYGRRFFHHPLTMYSFVTSAPDLLFNYLHSKANWTRKEFDVALEGLIALFPDYAESTLSSDYNTGGALPPQLKD